MTDPSSSSPIYSDFKGDPDMEELVEYFVGEMPQRLEELESSFASQDWDRLKTVAHQLKGASGGYGFETLGLAAASLETSLKQGTDEAADLQEGFDQLIDLCRRVSF